MSPRVAIVTPPVIKPCEPGLSGAAAAGALRRSGVDALSVDASIGWFRRALGGPALARALAVAEAAGPAHGELLALRRAAQELTRTPSALQRSATYADRKVYSSAVSHLENALRLASLAHPGARLRVADVEIAGARPQSSQALARFAASPGPFDEYLLEELLPRLERERVTHVGVSLTFLNQAFATFRLAKLLGERLPGLARILGGPLVECWAAIDAPLRAEPFSLFDRVVADDAAMSALVRDLGGVERPPDGPLSSELDAEPGYLSPEPVVPVALARGCYWRRCTFCPDHLHPRRRAGPRDALAAWLHAVAERHPGGAMLHLTDSALAPADLARVATVIRDGRLPLRWHGFVRVERALADPELAALFAQGGCALLQLGLETGSARLLGLLEKGHAPDLATQVLETLAGAGIRTLGYLLFGLPTETDDDREQTLRFVEGLESRGALHGLNAALLNLPRGSPMHAQPARFGITRVEPFGPETDLSLFDDFRCGASHPRLEARRWLGARFFKSPAVRRIEGELRDPFKANHACFLPGPARG